MSEIGELQLSDKANLVDVVELKEHPEKGDFIVEEMWSEGVMEVKKRRNEKLVEDG